MYPFILINNHFYIGYYKVEKENQDDISCFEINLK